MIFDKIDNRHRYQSHKGISKALEDISTRDFTLMEQGLYELECGIFFTVQDYETLPIAEKKLEYHKSYIDIQLVCRGRENFIFLPSAALTCDGSFDEDKDLGFFNEKPADILDQAGAAMLELGANMFALLYTEEAHAPGIDASCKQSVRKVVYKVPADE
jgi:YhcH/YjgK/YiaL family protein